MAAAIFVYVELPPSGILRTSFQTRFCNSVPRMSSGSGKRPAGRAMYLRTLATTVAQSFSSCTSSAFGKRA
jgi:hypothetical protein